MQQNLNLFSLLNAKNCLHCRGLVKDNILLSKLCPKSFTLNGMQGDANRNPAVTCILIVYQMLIYSGKYMFITFRMQTFH